MKKIRETFRLKLYYIFIISMIIPIITTITLFTVFYNKTIISQEKKNVEYILTSMADNIDVQLAELKNISNTYYLYKDIFQEIEGLNNPKLIENYEDLEKKRLENNYTMSISKILYLSKQELCDVAFFPINSEEGCGYSVDRQLRGLEKIQLEGYENEEWFQQAIEADGMPVFYENHIPEYRKGKNYEEVYSCVRALKNMNTKKIIGVTKIDASLTNLEEVIDVLNKEGKNKIVIANDTQQLVTTDETFHLKISDLKQGLRVVDKKIYHVQCMDIPETEWKLIYFSSIQDFVMLLLGVILLACLFMSVSMSIAFMVYKRYARETVEDMENITNALKEIQTGNLEAEVKVQSGNELHDIAVAVNKMTDNLKEYINKEYIWVIRQQMAEYQALQAQINPHFFYNTLNGFLALNRMGERKKLERSIINLTGMFRYTCSGSNETTIEQECSFLKEYLELEKVKYEERLDYMMWIDEECKNIKIPRLLLQPIVENCIVHGMGDTDTPIMITVMVRNIETKGIGKVTVVTVRDNGVGFDTGDVKDGKEHVGVDNVRIRAEMYWKDVIYQCHSIPGKGTKTTIVFGEDAKGELV